MPDVESIKADIERISGQLATNKEQHYYHFARNCFASRDLELLSKHCKTLLASLATARSEAIEECAKICDSHTGALTSMAESGWAEVIAKEIRSLTTEKGQKP